jgi:hypothetical protein
VVPQEHAWGRCPVADDAMAACVDDHHTSGRAGPPDDNQRRQDLADEHALVQTLCAVPSADGPRVQLSLAHRGQRKVYLLGARPEVVARVAEVIREHYPHASIVGERDGYSSDKEAAKVAESVRSSGTDLLFLGMMSSKREIFTGAFAPCLQVECRSDTREGA